MTVSSSPARTSVRTRRYAPKGNRPLRTTGLHAAIRDGLRHEFRMSPLDIVSCVRCNLPAANWRHTEPPQGRVA